MLTYEIISSVKRTFSRSKRAIALKNKHVVKGQKGKRGGKLVKCELCGELIPMYKSQLDHIDSITPVMLAQKVMSFIMLFERTFCDDKNLQVICKTCHDKKSKKERSERVKWRKKKKYLVCRVALGGRMKVIGITDLKELNDKYEVLAVYAKKKDADEELKRRQKL